MSSREVHGVVKCGQSLAAATPVSRDGVSMPASISVLCADDHPVMRDGIAFALQQERDIELVAEARDGSEAIKAFRQHRPDVTLMDLQMPGINGLAAMTTILGEFPNARIIVLTTYSGDVHASRALKLGAMGYLLKSMLRTELVSVIREVNAGRKRIPHEVAEDIASHLMLEPLSDRELEVIRCIAKGNSNRIVADTLGISEDTVKGHMRNVLTKLQANDRTHAVTIALKRGYLEG
jgi:DNA-binding NarL/FixJ family response regulator